MYCVVVILYGLVSLCTDQETLSSHTMMFKTTQQSFAGPKRERYGPVNLATFDENGTKPPNLVSEGVKGRDVCCDVR